MSPIDIKVRCTAVAALASAAIGVAVRVVGGSLADTPEPIDGASAVTALCTVALLGALAWGWLAVLAAVADAWRRAGREAGPGVRGSAHGMGAVRRWTLAACGVAVTGAALAGPPAQADVRSVPPAPSTAQATVLVERPVERLVERPVERLVERLVERPVERPVESTEPTRAGPGTVVVRAGDCLWSLAADEVQPGAGPATVTARWRAIYRANRDVIGADPDLIHPGQRLRLPR